MKTERKDRLKILLFLAVILTAASVFAWAAAASAARAQFETLSTICALAAEEHPGAESALLHAVKEYTSERAGSGANAGLLTRYGYRPTDFLPSVPLTGALLGLSTGLLLFCGSLFCLKRTEREKIRRLSSWLEEGERGFPDGFQISGEREGDFSKLLDGIYKTVLSLQRAREQATETGQRFSDNLSNIAHQLKTPVAVLSLSAQALTERGEAEGEKIGLQLDRLTHLEEALLLLARLDAGALEFEKREGDVYTLLNLAVDTLSPLAEQLGASVDLPEMGAAKVQVDQEWTLEALLNLLKNCMEHTPPGGNVHCRYEQNPLYTEIRLWDEGPGFSKEELPKLFQRFYRGERSRPGGAGLGLALAKELLERQNGTLRAFNLPEGGACFEIHLYSH